MKKDYYNNLLWELSPPNGAESSFLFGTIHLPDLRLFARIPQIKDLIDKSAVFMAEYPLDDGGDDGTQFFMIPNGESLNDILKSNIYNKIKKQLAKSYNLNLDHFSRYKPMILEQFLAEQVIEKRAGLPMDIMLWKYAKSKEKILLGAEDFQSQLEILENFPIEKQVRNLVKIARNPVNYKKQLKSIIEHYKKEDIRHLYKSSIKSLGKMKSILVYKRNIKISDSFGEQALDKKVVCAVGAGHLYGYKGLLRLLKHKGFKLKPVAIYN